jgi:aminoacylase
MIVPHQENEEMISFLQHYLRIDTSQPEPDYAAVCELFKAQAERDGLKCTIITLPSKKPVIVITHEGTNPNLPSLLLNHHMDVVPALNKEQWITPPFGGLIHDGNIIGRGAQDTKGLGVAHYFALKTLQDTAIPLQKTVHITIVPDEEIGGFTGTKQFIETDFFTTLNAQFVIDESIPSGDPTTIFIKVSERKPLQIKITTTGSLAHGSKLNCFNAIHELVNILHEFTTLHSLQQKERATTADGLLLSTNITSLVAGVHNNNTTTLNIVPETASATIDIRIPPTMAIDDIINRINDIFKHYPQSTYTILASVPDQGIENDYQTPLYHAVAKSIQQCGLSAQPLFFEATTDLRYYKSIGLDGVGLSPFTTHDTIHGTNELIPILDLIQAKDIMVNFLKNFCGHKEQ